MPIAYELRPDNFEDVVGQKHLVAEGAILDKLLKRGRPKSMIFYGPPGVGKTTVANIVANKLNLECVKVNAINVGVKEIRKIVDEAKSRNEDGIVLIVDEIQAINKKQQQVLLEVMEEGYVTLIASTADNPYFTIYKAILSRSVVFEFKPLTVNDIFLGLKRISNIVSCDYREFFVDDDVLRGIANISNADMRCAINQFEMLVDYFECEGVVKITLSDMDNVEYSKIMSFGTDEEYDILSAFHKSLRGSDENAALHYLARLIKAGDMQGIIRRLLCVASEDVGLANSKGVIIVNSCVQSALILGFPEARLPLAHATVYLCKSVKSNSIVKCVDMALMDLDCVDVGDIPLHLKDAHYGSAKKMGRGVEYKYPHDFNGNYVNQEYLPSELKGRKYYNPCKNRWEESVEEYWRKIKD